MTDRPAHKPIRSFVRREGRLTRAQDRALRELLPQYQLDDKHAPLNFEQIFGNDNPVVLEIGFGNGSLLAAQSREHPDFNFIGIEVHRPGVGRLLQQLNSQGNTNVRVSDQDATELLEQRIPAHALYAIWLYFPDPWPKKRHHKRRIVNQRFLDQVARTLQETGVLHMATDWQDYAEHMHSAINEHQAFRLLPDPTTDYPFQRPATHFEQRGQRKGHKITDLYAVIDPEFVNN